MRCSPLAGLLVVTLLGCAARAEAFVDSTQFFASRDAPNSASLGASGEGVYFTGAPRYAGLDCSSCHQGGPQRVSIRLGAEPAGLFTDGYQPGAVYQLLVELIDEQAGLAHATPGCTEPPAMNDKYSYLPCNNNSFALEIDNGGGPLKGAALFCTGKPEGGVCPKPDPRLEETVVAPDGDAIFGNRARDPMNAKLFSHNDPRAWRFYFTAPPAGSGPLTLYVGAVDGNGGDGTASNDQDIYGDDTVRAVVPLSEAGVGGPLDAVAGCDMTGSRPRSAGTLLMWTFVIVAWRLRRRGSRTTA